MRPARPEPPAGHHLPLEEDSIRIPWELAEVLAPGLVLIFAILARGESHLSNLAKVDLPTASSGCRLA